MDTIVSTGVVVPDGFRVVGRQNRSRFEEIQFLFADMESEFSFRVLRMTWTPSKIAPGAYNSRRAFLSPSAVIMLLREATRKSRWFCHCIGRRAAMP